MKLAKVGFLAVVMAGLILPSYAREEAVADLLPTMSSQAQAVNPIWVGTFQLVWNDATEKFGNIVQFNPLVEELNKKSFTTDDLSESAYYKNQGVNTAKLKKTIENGIQEKFGEKSDILDSVQWDGSGFIFYAMLKKDFKFKEKFEDMGKGAFGRQGAEVEYFGTKNIDILYSNVHPLFYNSRKDFAVRLNTTTGDEVYLFRTNEEGNLEELYNLMQEKIANERGEYEMSPGDTFKAPKLKLSVKRSFDELQGLSFKNGYRIQVALENVEFNMDEAGVKVKSEAIIAAYRGLSFNSNFDFTDRYVVFIKEKGKAPYFALLVEDPTKLQ